MSSVPQELPELIQCGATTSLTAHEAAKLHVICRDVPVVQAFLSCELAGGHDGSHVVVAATADDGELWWWLQWGSHWREVRQIDLCEARWLDDPYLDDCLLPEGHPGPHSFQLQAG